MDTSTIETIEETFGVKLSDNVKFVLTTPDGLLTPYQRQERFLLSIALAPRQCPACLSIICQLSAAPGADLKFNESVPDDQYVCPKCETHLVWHVALIGDHFFTLHPDEAKPVKQRG